MSDFFVGEIRAFAFGIVPQDWALADGSLLQITQNQALYSLLGSRYGGNGTSTFALPDLRGRTPVQVGTVDGYNYVLAASTGTETVTLTLPQIPAHVHDLTATDTLGTTGAPAGNLIATVKADDLTPPGQHPLYAVPTTGSTAVSLLSTSVGTAGSGAPHQNMQPSAVVNYCIAIRGIYPPRQY